MGYRDVATREAITSVTNFTQPGASPTTIARNRGIWTVGTLYNVNDMAKYTGGGANLLILCEETHVAAAEFEPEKWGVLVDVGQLAEGGITPEELSDAVLQATSQVLLATEAAAEAEVAAQGAGEAAEAAEDHKAAAETARLVAEERAAEAFAQRQAAEAAARSAAIIPTVTLVDADGPTYAVDTGLDAARANARRRDVVRLRDVICKPASADLTLELHPNVFKDDVAFDGSPGFTWFGIVNDAPGTYDVYVAAAGGSSATVPTAGAAQAPTTRTATDSTLATGDTVINIPVTVPAGNDRKAVLFVHGVYSQQDLARNTRLTCAQASSVTEVVPDTSTGGVGHTGQDKITSAAYVLAFGNSAAPTSATLVLTVSQRFFSILPIFVPVNGAPTYDDEQGDGSQTPSETGSITLTSDAANSLAVFSIAKVGGDILPLSLSAGGATQIYSGSTGSRGEKDVSAIVGKKALPSAGGTTYTAAHSSSALRQHSWLGLVFEPGGGVASVSLRPPGPHMLTPGEQGIVKALSDGTTYLFSKV